MRAVIYLFFLANLWAEAPRAMPEELFEEYTLGGIVPVYEWYIDGTYSESQAVRFAKEEIDELIARASNRESGYYGSTDQYLYAMLDKYHSFIEGKKVGIIGSVTPWYEAVILSFGGHPTTIEYNRIICEDPRCQVLTVEEFDQSPFLFDTILSISSIEHDGLGRYGDPINPWGDTDTMKKLHGMLNEGGLLFLSIPVGRDAVYWNAHRVYGPLRLPLLFEGWETVDTSGFSLSDLHVPEYSGHQPVFVLKPQ